MEEYDKNLDEYCDKIIDDNNKIVGDLYLITNNVTKKQYVGQALSHRLNHKRYRPFGFKGRLNDHISQANTRPEKQTYLHSSMRKHGESNFSIELIKRCKVEELDTLETEYIVKYNTLYPNGYNLTTGGKFTTFIGARVINNNIDYLYEKKFRDHQTPETRKKISAALKEYYYGEETHKAAIKKNTNNTIRQHMKNRMLLFEDITLPKNINFDDYIRTKRNNHNILYVVKINSYSTTFYGKFTDYDLIKKRVYDFLRSLQNNNIATESNCGKLLKTSDTTSLEKSLEGTQVMTGSNGNNAEGGTIRSQAPKIKARLKSKA